MGSHTLHIVRAGLEQADELGYVHAVSWNAAYQDILPAPFLAGFTPEKRAALFRRNLPEQEKNAEEFYLFRSGRSPAGMAILGDAEDRDMPDDTGEICAFYFLPDTWGTGLAQEGMAYCLARLRERGSTQAMVWVLAENRRARRFYEKTGFHFDGGRHAFSLSLPADEIKPNDIRMELRYSRELTHG